jgi:hypothetical protein
METKYYKPLNYRYKWNFPVADKAEINTTG